jgi:hypothetical protein
VAEPDTRNYERGTMSVILTDECGKTLYDGKIYGIPIYGDVILQKSIEFFNDPEPCYKHRGAIYMRLWAEIEQYLEPLGGRPVPVVSLPEALMGYIDIQALQE